MSACINSFSLLNYALYTHGFFCILERKNPNSLNVIETRVEKNELIINTPIKTKDGEDKNYFVRIFIFNLIQINNKYSNEIIFKALIIKDQ